MKVEIEETELNRLKADSTKLKEVIDAIEEVQQSEDSGTDDIGAAVLDVLQMWM